MKEEREGKKERGKNREEEEDTGIRRVMQHRIERECLYQGEKKRGEIEEGKNIRGGRVRGRGR